MVKKEINFINLIMTCCDEREIKNIITTLKDNLDDCIGAKKNICTKGNIGYDN